MGNESFFQRVYHIVAGIPAGKVATYGQVSLLAGQPKAARVVGYAMSHSPPGKKLPCHRVVNRMGQMAPEYAFGGEAIQRFLLEAEGVIFLDNGTVDLQKHLWRPSRASPASEDRLKY